MAFLLKKAVFSPNVELEGIARQVVEASHLGSCACFAIDPTAQAVFLRGLFPDEAGE